MGNNFEEKLWVTTFVVGLAAIIMLFLPVEISKIIMYLFGVVGIVSFTWYLVGYFFDFWESLWSCHKKYQEAALENYVLKLNFDECCKKKRRRKK